MNKCFICGEDAIKKNSHLLPWFLIKNVITKNGSGIRDTEMCFSIKPSSLNEMYIGRSILPDSINENFDSLEKLETNPFSRDNILCIKCENKIGRLEAIFSSIFYKKRMDEICFVSSSNENEPTLINEEKYSYSLMQLFIQSIFIRCSIGNYGTVVLKTKVSAKIIKNLNHAFKLENFEKIQANAKVELLHQLPIVSIYLNYSQFHDSTQNFILTNKSNNPYQLIAGNWIYQLFESYDNFLNCNEWLYGLRSKLNSILRGIIMNHVPFIVVLDSVTSKKFNNTLVDDITERRQINLRRQIRFLYTRLFKNTPTEEMATYIEYQFYKKFKISTNYTECLIEAFLELKEIN
jgi:hypothetical protein